MVADGEDEAMSLVLRRAETVGRPVGEAGFLQELERRSGRSLSPAKRGRKPARELNGLSP
jgi:putative transposase